MIAEKLKKSVLHAAIQGKLTKQLSEDGDAKTLLKELKKEKVRLIKEKIIRKEKPLPEIAEDSIPFDIPDNWCWVRLGDLANYKKGPFGSSLTKSMFIPDGINSIKVYEQKNAIQKDETLGEYYIDNNYYEDKMKSFTVESGDIIISCAGTIGESYILPAKIRTGIINQALMRVRVFNGLDKLYFLKIFNYAINTDEAKGKGSAIKNIPPFKILKNIPVPLAPINEQKRIVECLEEVFPEIDKLNTFEYDLDTLQNVFPEKMKAAILQYAVKGKLTEQLKSDGDARDLVKDIQNEKSFLIRKRKIPKEKSLPKITEDEIPYDIPDNWCWVRLGTISYNHGLKKPDEKFTYIQISSINNESNTLGDLTNIIKPEDAPSRARKIVYVGDVIYATVRPYLHNICRIDREIKPEPIVSTGFEVVCTPKIVLNNYLFYCFLSPMFDSYANDSDNSKGVAYPAINKTNFTRALIPLPPLAEQQRIVQSLENILPEVNELKELMEPQK